MYEALIARTLVAVGDGAGWLSDWLGDLSLDLHWYARLFRAAP